MRILGIGDYRSGVARPSKKDKPLLQNTLIQRLHAMTSRKRNGAWHYRKAIQKKNDKHDIGAYEQVTQCDLAVYDNTGTYLMNIMTYKA